MTARRKIDVLKPSRDAVGWMIAVAFAAALHVLVNLKATEVAYELASLRALVGRLEAERGALEVEVSSWASPQVLDTMARTRLGMKSPAEGQVVALP